MSKSNVYINIMRNKEIDLEKYRNKILEEAAREADKTAKNFILGQMRVGCIAAGRAIRALKTETNPLDKAESIQVGNVP